MRISAISAALLIATTGGSLPPTPIPTPPPATDQYAINYCTLLHLNGADASTTFTDSSERVWTNHGATIKTDQSIFGGSSAYFNGATWIDTPDSVDFTVGTKDFTLEFWMKSPGNGAYDQVCGQRNAVGDGFASFAATRNNTTSSMSLSYTTGGSFVTTSSSAAVFNDVWHHIAIVRFGTSFKLYVDGTVSATLTLPANFAFDDLASKFSVGRAGDYNGQYYKGYVDEFRVVVGKAVYTANFTVPSAPFTDARTVSLHHMDGANNATTFVDQSTRTWTTNGNAKLSTSQFKYGTASGAFDGSGDYISAAHTPDFNIESSDFTLEGWVYRSATGAIHTLISKAPAAGTSGWEWSITAADKLQFLYGGGSSVLSTGTIPANQWTHVATSRTGTTLTHYINGGASGSGTVANGTADTANTIKIGVDRNLANGFNGYLDDLRITKGAGRYSANFTPPNQAYPDIFGSGITIPPDDLYRVVINSTQVRGVVTLGELNLYTASAAVTRNALSASSADPSFPVTNCVDGSATTVYKSTAIPAQWVLFQVPNGTVVDHMTMTPPATGSLGGVPYDFSVQKYDGFANWNDIITCVGQSLWSNGVARTYSVSGSPYAADPTPPPPPPEPTTPYPLRAIGSTTISVTSKGAVGNGVTDDLAAINAAIAALPSGGGTITFPNGTFLVDVSDTKYININKSGVKLKLSAGTVIKAKPNGLDRYYIIRAISTVHDIEITGGWIQGERTGHTGTTGEWGYGIYTSASKVSIYDTKVTNCWGDGIGLWGSASNDVWVYNVISDNNRRQAITVGPVTNWHIEKCTLTNTNGTAPAAGIDIEPDTSSASNGTIKDNTITGNAGAGILIWQHSSHDIVITNNIVNNNNWGIYGDSVSNIEVSYNTCKNNTHEGIRVDKNNNNWTITQNHMGQNSGGADRVPDQTKTGYQNVTSYKRDLLIYASATNINVLTNYYE